MTRSRLICAFALLVFFAVVSPAAALSSAGGGWVWQNPLPFGWDLSDVTFSDSQHVWAATFTGGTVLRSADAGLTWEPSFTGVEGALWDLSCPDGLHCAVLYTQTSGFHGADVVAFTTDGGSTWTRRTFSRRTYGGIVGIEFLDAEHCWIAAGSGLFASSDGGATWSRLRTPATALEGVDFSDVDHGWTDSFSNRVFYTADGGATWAARTPPGKNVWVFVSATGAGSAWVRLARSSGDDVIMRTADAGRTWQRRFVGGVASIESLLALSDDEAWVATDDEVLGEVMGGATPSENPRISVHHTTDGGATWQARSLGQDFPAQLAGSPDGVVVAGGTCVWRSADRGASWAGTTR